MARLLREAPPGLPVLYERHLDTCAKRADADEPGHAAPAGIPLMVQRDALAAALDRRTHEFVPGEVDGEPSDLCAASEPYTCGHVAEHPVHATPRAILVALAARSETS